MSDNLKLGKRLRDAEVLEVYRAWLKRRGSDMSLIRDIERKVLEKNGLK